MRIKEGGSRRLIGGRRGREESEDYYDEEDDGQEEQPQEEANDGYESNKRRRTDTKQQEAGPATLPEDYEIALSGHLLMIYQRDEIDPPQISNFNMVIKGKWKLTVED